MKKFLNRKKSEIRILEIIFIFFLIQPFIDVITGLMLRGGISISLGIVLRGGFIVFLIFYFLFKCKGPYKIWSLAVLGVLVLFQFIFLLLNLGQGSFFIEVSNTFRMFYYPMILILMGSIYLEKRKMLPKKYIAFFGFIYIVLIFLGDITGTAVSTYQGVRVGSVGYFNSANEIGAIIAITIPFMFKYIFDNKITFFKIIIFFMTIYSVLMMGTKTPLVVMVITAIVYTAIFGRRLQKKFGKKILILLGIFIVAIAGVSFLVFPKTDLYKNIVIHEKFLQESHVEDKNNIIENYVLSSRGLFLANDKKIYDEGGLKVKLSGIGYPENHRMIEMDPFDILYIYGIIGAFIYLFSTLYMMFLIWKSSRGKTDSIYLISFILGIMISIVAGHVLSSPSVSILLVFITIGFMSRGGSKNDFNLKGLELEEMTLVNVDRKKLKTKNALVVLNYNDFESTSSFIKRVEKINSIDLIIAVDNNSSDNSYELLKVMASEKLIIIRAEKNGGYGYGNNLGCKYIEEHIEEPYNIMISNPDVIFCEETVLNLAEILKKRDDIALVGPEITEGNTLNRGWRIPGASSEIFMNIPFTKERAEKKFSKYPEAYYNEAISLVECVSGCCFMIKGEVFKNVKYFDEKIFLYYEENILGVKLKEMNFKSAIVNSAKALHNHSKSIDKSISNLNKFKALKRSQRYFQWKYMRCGITSFIILYLTTRVVLLGKYIKNMRNR